MPKYYVRDGSEQAIVDSPDSITACCKAILYFFNSFAVNGFYIVSERGFAEHDDDTIYKSNDILDIISKDFGKKPKKDEDDY
jgi:hypothetical protein